MTFIEACRTRVLIADGAMGTELQRAGLAAGRPGEEWNLEHPERVEAIHRAYADAGADLILTNTFGANPWVLSRYRLEGSQDDIIAAACRSARKACPPGGFVLGDIGPTGVLLKPLGDATIDEFNAAFLRQARCLLAGGVDAIIIETMTALEEAVAAVAAAREAGAPAIVSSMAFDRTKDGRFRTLMGISPERAAAALVEAGADAVGANCGTNMSVADFVELTVQFAAAVSCPIIMEPNAGRPELVDGKTIYNLSPEDFAAGVAAVVDAGARIVGGCCGTTPVHIAAVRGRI